MGSPVASKLAHRDRSTVATYSSYGEAQKAVDVLSDLGFPVEKTAIVAQEIRFVEQVTGRRGLASAAVEGGLTGAGVGALVGFLLGLFTFFEPLVSGFVLAFWGLVLGAIVGSVLGLVSQGLTFGRRDFGSVGAFHAGRFDVVADPDVAAEATKHLREAELLLKPKR